MAWSTGYGGGSDSALGLTNGIGFRWYWAWFAWIANWMGWKLHGKGYECMGRGLQSARAHAKCVGPLKMRGPMQSAQAALWVRGTPSARTRAKCVGRGSIAPAALSARAAIAWRGEWAALPTHLPRTCHLMPTQCNHCSTRVGCDEPQSPGVLRVNRIGSLHYVWDIPVLKLKIWKCFWWN